MNTKTVYYSYQNEPVTGLTLAWVTLKKVSDNADVASPPTFTEVGGGFYKYTAPVPLGEQWAGVIDGGIANLDVRKVPVTLWDGDRPIPSVEIIVTPVYDEVADTLQFIVFALVGGVICADIADAEVEVFDSTHTTQFTVDSDAPTNGVIVLSKTTPALSAMEGYYCKATVTILGIEYVGVETMVTLN